jgi:signal transduction histidine kinase
MSKVSHVKSAIIYTFLIVMTFCIPSYFAIRGAIVNERALALNEILEWVGHNEAALLRDDGVHKSASVRFRAAIYSDSHTLLRSNLHSTPDTFDFRVRLEYPYIYYQKELTHDGQLYFLLVESDLNYNKIAFIAAILLIAIPIIIILMSSMFVHASIYPYKKLQAHMEEFFHDTLHDLKTPLSIMRANLELMPKSARTAKYVGRLNSATKQMQNMYEDLEYFIKHKRVNYPKEIIDASALLRERLEFFGDIATAKGIDITPYVDDEVHIYISRAELVRLIDNNLTNALKYSFHKGRIEVTLRRAGCDLGELAIYNEGDEIKDATRLFERGARENIGVEGLGLGLNIVRTICAHNAISIDVRSSAMGGAMFAYSFALAPNFKEQQ